ncbi:MAG: efflux transporter outer membrane subunit [Methylococcaceae bacterium]|nr:efflux transporter outer membrane subunit [Methylococcaceae bacterium]
MVSSGCSVDVKEVPTPVALDKTFSIAGSEDLKSQWWLAFNDEALNQLIDTALRDNFSLKAAFNRVEQARATARKSGADLVPSINGTFETSRKITDKLESDSFSLGLLASYEIDLWGRIRANLHAAELETYAIEEDLHAAAISLSADIATTWYRLIEQRKQLLLLNQQIKTNQDLAGIVEARFRATIATAADVFQQRQVLEGVVGDKETVLATINVLEHQLAVLSGKAPKQIKLLEISAFPDLAPVPKTGLSADLIKRRPDLRKAYFSVQAADQRIGAAIADRFPKLSLSAGINTSSPDLQSLFNNWLATLAGNLVMPIIDGSRRLSEVERVEAKARESLNTYATALLTATREVEDALVQEYRQQNLVSSLAKQVLLSQQANEQITLRYRHGAIDFLRVLSIYLTQQGLERSHLRAERELIEFRINLHRALAGSFQLPPSFSKIDHD